MSRPNRLTAVLSGILLGMGLRSLANVIKQDKAGREKAIVISLLICVLLLALTALFWALGLI